jgi:hypothetical protein
MNAVGVLSSAEAAPAAGAVDTPEDPRASQPDSGSAASYAQVLAVLAGDAALQPFAADYEQLLATLDKVRGDGRAVPPPIFCVKK